MNNSIQRAREERHDVIEFLSHFSISMETVVEPDHAMRFVAHYLCEVIMADSLAIFKREEDDTFKGIAVSGAFPLLSNMSDKLYSRQEYIEKYIKSHVLRIGEGPLGRVLRDSQDLFIPDTSTSSIKDELPESVKTIMAVPMRINGRLEGLICTVNSNRLDSRFTVADLRMLKNLSYQAAMASNLVSIYSERNKQARIMQELELGREIQKSLLPDRVPVWGEYQFYAYGKPALEVAGDFYDFVEIDDSRLMVVIADAVGKGVPACMLMAMCRSFVRSLVEHYEGLENFMEELNQCLYRDTEAAHFLTMAVVVIDRENNVCEYANAGHTPLIIKRENGLTRRISPTGPALGLLPPDLGFHFDTLSFCMEPGNNLFLFTDGLNEALNDEGEEFGLNELESKWREQNGSLQQQADGILAVIDKFCGTTPQADDQTMVVISRTEDHIPTPAGHRHHSSRLRKPKVK